MIFLEREHILSRILVNRIVGFLQAKKENCSTRQGFRVGTDFESFNKLREVGDLSYLVYSRFKCFDR